MQFLRSTVLLIFVLLLGINPLNSQLQSVTISNITLNADGNCMGSPQTVFRFQLEVQTLGGTYAYHLLDANNLVLGWQLGLSGDRNQSRLVGVSSAPSAGPFKIVVSEPGTFLPRGALFCIPEFYSFEFDPNLLDSDCPVGGNLTPRGVCCFNNGVDCQEGFLEACCQGQGGAYQGDGTTLDSIAAIPTLSEWGLITLLISFLILGIVAYRQQVLKGIGIS